MQTHTHLFNEFYVPKHKFELENYLTGIYPKNRNKFRHMMKSQLYAIYYRVRRIQNEI